jgi:hypothetical protein
MLSFDHCQNCGAVFEGSDGYSSCCNEPCVAGGECELIYCGHGEYAAYYGEWNGREFVAVRGE